MLKFVKLLVFIVILADVYGESTTTEKGDTVITTSSTDESEVDEVTSNTAESFTITTTEKDTEDSSTNVNPTSTPKGSVETTTDEETRRHTSQEVTTQNSTIGMPTLCDLNPCENQGTCTETADGDSTCLCPPDYIGQRCQIHDKCIQSQDGTELCKDGSCVYGEDPVQSRFCKCFVGSFWDSVNKECQSAKSPCAPNPCLFDGLCEITNTQFYKCSCADGHVGARCENTDLCGINSEGVICQNGECVLDASASKQYCKCEKGRYYDVVTNMCQALNPPCEPNPCGDFGSCVKVSSETFNCTCKIGFSGQHCEIEDRCVNDDGELQCLDGECKLVLEGFQYCSCSKGHYLDEATGACKEIKKPCIPNPCANDGICSIVSADEYNCTCAKGYTGTKCTERNRCILDGGDTFCKLSTCVMDDSKAIYICKCAEEEYFDYGSRICKTIDLCPLMTCKKNEACEQSICKCKGNFKENNVTGECEPNFCVTRGCTSDEMQCEENQKGSPEDFKCSCKEGFGFNGTHCYVATCAFPTLNDCDQICRESGEEYVCDCKDSFQLKNDNKTCEHTGNETCSNTTCNMGTCVKTDVETCQCPQGYIEHDGKCSDMCSEGKLPVGLCPENRCEPVSKKGFRCLCDGKYKLSSDKVTCTARKMCSDGEAGSKKCHEKKARCAEEPESDEGFNCACPVGAIPGKDGVCQNICDIEENQRDCADIGGKCQLDDEYRVTCRCPPGFDYSNPLGLCNKLAENSYLVTLPIVASRYVVESTEPKNRRRRSVSDSMVDVLSLRMDITQSMAQLYEGFMFADVLNCKKVEDYLLCKTELQFLEAPLKDLDRIKINGFCNFNDSVSTTECILPPSLVFRKDKIQTQVTIQKTDPCDTDIKENFCSPATKCSSAREGKSFYCTCMPGYRARSKSFPIQGDDSFIETCNDIDECAEGSPCPVSSTCTNTLGSYRCSCLSDYRSINESADPQDYRCIGLCDQNPCDHGKCSKVADNKFECSCEAGFSGTLCNLVDKNYKDAKMNTVIVGAVLGGVLLITIILYAASVARLRKKKFLDEPNQMLYAEEMTERRPARQGESNNAFDRD